MIRRKIDTILTRDSFSATCFCGFNALVANDIKKPTLEEIEFYDICPCCSDSYLCEACGEEIIAEWESPEKDK